MKNVLHITGLLIVVMLLSSCKKWVDYDAHEDFLVTEKDYLQTADDYKTMVVSVYSPLQWLNQAVPIGDIASDNAVTGGENASDVLGLQQIDDYTHTPTNDYLTELWKSAYEGINRANYLTQYKDKTLSGKTIDFTGKEALYGEIYFLRAYYYFTLVKFFGDVPLFFERRLILSDSKTLQRSPQADVYAQIEKDLNAAIVVLPPSNSQPGRVTKYAAQALLGKVLIYENKFDAAATVLENVVNGPFNLVSNFGDIFLQGGENGIESVFEIQYSNLFPYYNWGAATRGQGNYAVQQCGIRGLTGSSPYAPGWSTNLPTQELAKAYAAGDQRKNVTVLDIEAYSTAHPEFTIKYQVAPYKNTGLYNQKYLPRKGETSGQIELNYLNNYRTIRFAEVLLLAAEANNRATSPNDAKARDYLNRVRRRAFRDNLHDVTASGNTLKQAIWDERRLELAMEGDRFFDLVRTGRAATVISGFKAGKHELFPIPQREIDISQLKQNPGY
ncbi:RagB/SusD family nutrient uptake outer membrane protein [Chitinophaga qingshengii]|uniref:RagB/SusD family nutrient uptake outer membrane protein n=1 Tax=Chitinophaga qingshengii TaxID=1569794 RepID=A0ABR7TM81_9BACT|nr:RagB/SusD family nutrient uptake outer membrane protein [Chitinophaga qingshengii]MBC9930611.1 RagB/SusD family nutrient uptake outer membrane protein [Chitinophaga qingshengii]